MTDTTEKEELNKKQKQASATDMVKVSVRTLVEFIMRSGDIDNLSLIHI